MVLPSGKKLEAQPSPYNREAQRSLYNREAWLTEVAARVRPLFRGFTLPKFNVTCGWPSSGGIGGRRVTLGQCFGAESSKGGAFELFISPLLDQPLEVAGTLCHELSHVAAGIKAGHGKGFVIVCRAVGLTSGRPRSVMPGERLNEQLRRIIEVVGDYPHDAMAPVLKQRKQTPSVFSVVCTACGCRLTMSKKWLEAAGYPTCGCGGSMVLRVLHESEGE